MSASSVPDALIARRQSAHALNMLVRELGLGTIGRIFVADRDEDWAVVSSSQVRALGEGVMVAEVWLEGDLADIRIPDAFHLARSEHRSDFQPWEYGIIIDQARDFLHRKLNNDIEAKIHVPDVPGITLPQQPIPRATLTPNVKVIKSRR